MDPTGIIGVDGTLPWYYPADLKRFKEVTMGHVLIMGRTTWESLPKPLPGRTSYVLSRQENPTSKHPEGSCTYFPSLEDALEAAKGKTIWICGGAQVYTESLEKGLVTRLDVTIVPSVNVQPGQTETRFPTRFFQSYQLVYEGELRDDSRIRILDYLPK